mmetsp:Transcript_2431/g.8892  ORF Transcript_2431/g.8892 Transcript_2431/m.8892 type:complete len:231 (-) Transcript_2431:765-1457(-)
MCKTKAPVTPEPLGGLPLPRPPPPLRHGGRVLEGRDPEHVGMGVHRGADRPAVTSPHADQQLAPPRNAVVVDQVVPADQPLPCEREPAEGVLAEGVHPGLEDHQLWLTGVESPGKAWPQSLQVLVIRRAIRNIDVQIRGPAGLPRVVVRPVDREGEDVVVALEDVGRAVPLVDVEVHNQDGEGLLAMEGPRGHSGHGDVVEDAEPLPGAAKGVVRAARRVRGHHGALVGH